MTRASQEERIKILKMALTEKKVHSGSHYDIKPNALASGRINPGVEATGMENSDQAAVDNEEHGVYL